jgi:DNA-binding response OmpR family regulator
MLVEDDKAVRTSLATILRNAGYLVVEAEDGFVGLDRLRERHARVVILDLGVPVLDGFGFLERLDSPPPPWVIVYSAFGLYSSEDLSARFDNKVFRSLRKPIPPNDLIAAVADAMREEAGTLGT